MKTFLFLMLGYPGSGKSMVAKIMSKELASVVDEQDNIVGHSSINGL